MQQVGDLDCRPFSRVVRAVEVGLAELLRHDVRGGALKHRDVGALIGELLGDVVAAVAGADDDGLLALPCVAPNVLARVDDGSGEVVGAFERRDPGLGRDTGRHDEVARLHGPGRAVGAGDLDRPASFGSASNVAEFKVVLVQMLRSSALA